MLFCLLALKPVPIIYISGELVFWCLIFIFGIIDGLILLG